MTGSRFGERRRVGALALLMPAVAAAISVASCASGTDGPRAGDCSLLDQIRKGAQIGLTVSPSHPEAGDLVTIGRTDRHTMDFGPFMLYGGADVGCRTFALERDGDGPSWVEVTKRNWFGYGAVVSPSARTEEYVLPEVAEHGAYLLCTDDEQGSALCADVTI